MKKCASGLVYVLYLLLYFLFCLIGFAARLFPSFRNLWLVAERKTDGRDNGYHFFKYLNEKHPEINSAYIIDKHSPDYEKMKKIGKIIQPYTARHFLAFCCAKVRISTHYMSCSPEPYRFAALKRYGLIFGKDMLIRHGIAASDLRELHYPKAKVDLLVCSAYPEFRDMSENYGHPNGVVEMTGLCRYDRLLSPHTVKKQILVMPTWRYYLWKLSDEEFMQSEYFKQFSALLNNEALSRVCAQKGYEIVLYLHHEMQRFSHLFESDLKTVKVLHAGGADVQQLLMESAMLVTDFSSVFFDFAYMGKPLLYLQFDADVYYKQQYGKSYFDCTRDGFGPVYSDAENAAEYIAKKVEDGMAEDEVYAARAKAFFGARTADHCEKVYRAILKRLK